MKSKRMTFIDCEDFRLDLEYNDQFFILHMPIINVSKGSIVHLKIKLEELQEFSDTIGYGGIYTGIDPNNKPMVKLMRMIKAEHQGDAEGMAVYKYMGEK